MGKKGLTAWFRNCSHENQPVLVLNINEDLWKFLEESRFRLTKNDSSDSYDLTIINVTYSDEGFYYCATEGKKVEDNDKINGKSWYNYSKIIRNVSISSNRSHNSTNNSGQNVDVCWNLLFSVCPVVSVLSALLSVLVYRICQKTVTSSQNSGTKQNTRNLTRQTQQDEDVCYAALEIQHSSLKPKRKRTTQASDFSTYSAVNKSQL
ncbi:uncharacterized protein LOC112156935 [Oryzias melastigma]|uniref:uncharacterized protein LOC112156935 n=1 Tax=Oryzias melastigma TaxID=30732 RepID=UPI00168CB055|nr:uncharacterized protein LOC112156935 [Oryzias melastigma]